MVPRAVHLTPVHWPGLGLAFGVASAVALGVGVAASVDTAVAVGASVGESDGTTEDVAVGTDVAVGAGDEAAFTHAVRRSGIASDIARTLGNPEYVRPPWPTTASIVFPPSLDAAG
jgi:hypothetical protein